MKKTMTMVLVIFLIFTLIGCSGIEPEKRRYPLAMGVDWADGQFQVYYGMPDLPASTGQDKQGKGSLIGEDMYVFEGENVDNLMNLNQSLGTSLGEYLTGIYENRMTVRQDKGVTLKEVYYKWYEERELPNLPTLQEADGKLSVEFV